MTSYTPNCSKCYSVDLKYNFVITQKEPEQIICFVCRTEKSHPDYAHAVGYGHHSVSFTLDSKLIYAGSICFKNGELISWTNESGHYLPSSKLHHHVFSEKMKKLLPHEKFKPAYKS